MRVLLVAIVVLAATAGSSRGQAIDKQVLDQVKEATVLVKLKAGKLKGNGTGFAFQVRSDAILVLTNRHVAAPDPDELPKGAQVELSVVFRSGTPQQQELPARVLAFDEREARDLAVLEVKGARFPPRPIVADQTAAEAEFSETMPVYALGFPLGGLIQQVVDNRTSDPAITVTTMSISSFRRDDSNRLARIQLNGPLIEGNSGGPIVDARGRLVGVAVSRVRGEAVGFAIPPTVVAAFLDGDLGRLTAELLAPQGGKAQIKLSVQLVDPLGRVQGAAVRYARQPSGGPEPPRPDSRGGWRTLMDGTNVPLTIARGVAGGTFTLPYATAEDRKLVFQFVLTDANGRAAATKPVPVNLPERPGMIAGITEESRPKTTTRWSCEVNLADGVKMSHQPGVTTIAVEGGSPMVNAPQYKLFNAPSALTRVGGDFVALVKVSNDFDPGGDRLSLPTGKKLPIAFQGAGLLIWQDEKNFVRLERCKGSDGDVGQIHRVLVEIYKGGREVGLLYSKSLPEQPFILAARRRGSTVQLLYADRPDHLVVFRELAMDFQPEVLVGVSASNLSTHPFEARFEGFELKGTDGQPIEAKPVMMTSLADGGAVRRPDGTLVLEGAQLKVLKAMGGSAAPQANMDKYQGQWTDNRQLLWRPAKMGDALALELPVDAAGKYDLGVKLTTAPDYAKVYFALDGKSLLQGKSTDLYSKEIKPAGVMSLGSLTLTKGKHRFTVTVQGKNPNSGGYSVGIDELQLTPAR